jgi:tetratricopeptide (TPR) repeat protein
MGGSKRKEAVSIEDLATVMLELMALRHLLDKKGIISEAELDAEKEAMLAEVDQETGERTIDSLLRDAKRKEPARQIKSAHKKLGRKLKEGDERGAAEAYAKLGELYTESGEYEQALGSYEQGMTLYHKLREKENAAAMLSSMASVELCRERYAKAEGYARKGLTIFRQLGEQEAVAAALHQLAMIAEGRDDAAGARKLYEESLITWRRLKSDGGVLAALHPLAGIAAAAAETSSARQLYKEALGLARKLGDEDMAADILKRLGKLR